MAPFGNQFGSQRLPTGNHVLTPTDISVITAVPQVGTLLAIPFTAIGADRLGRKKMVHVACVVSLIGATLQTAAYEKVMLVIGRTLGSMSIFLFLTLGTGWLAEVAPPELRGSFASLSITAIDFAAVVTACISQGTKNLAGSTSYRIPIGLQVVWPLIISLGAFFVHDSPTFFLIKGKDDMAEESLRSIRGGYSDTEIYAELDALRAQTSLRQAEAEVAWNELFKGTNLRRTLLSLSIPNFQQLSGIAFATNYATIFLMQVAPGQDPFVLVIGLTVLALGGAVTGLLLVDRIGRRTLALGTFVPLFFINTVIGALGFVNSTTYPVVAKAIAAFSLMFGFFFAAGFGPLTYVVAGELPTGRLRNKTTSFTFFTLISFATACQYALPYLSQSNGANLGAKVYLIFSGWMLITILTVFFCLPETKGRSPAELDEMFAARVPARKFKTYVCGTSTSNFIAAATAKSSTNVYHEETMAHKG
ncbi:general substrate transporter [Cadophora sp. MPI-SDFR-AT-0126]|nr:general substrate transporter [Leotiomycetes sp. MPI-SDFR-AT-0126]